MATTTNYGWTTPDDTALVKDGAAAIRTLGSSVDTTTKALNPSTTLGDIEYRSSTANTNTRLPIGTTGQLLTVAGGVPSWATPSSSSGLTLLTNASFSAVSSYSLPANTFSATYTNYKVVIDITSFSASNTFIARMRAAGSDYSGNQYLTQTVDGSGTTASANDAATNTSISLGDATGTNYVMEMELYKPYVANRTWAIAKFYFYDGANFHSRLQGNRVDTSTQYDSMSIIPSTGTITGRIYVYGYAI